MPNETASKGLPWLPSRSGPVAGIRETGPLLRSIAPALAVAIVIFLRASLTPSGYLSSDSRFYLAAATNLGRGVGWYVANDGSAPAGLEPFSDWPIGYPTLIFIVAQTFGTSAFVAAKVLGGVLVLGCAAMIQRVFGTDGPVCALPLAFASTLEIFSYAWSEVPFITLLIASASLITALWTRPDKAPVLRSVLLGTCCIGLFLCRYVGAFSLALPAIASLVALCRRHYRTAAANLLMFVATATIIALYLRHNEALTGFATGMPRQPPTDAWTARLAMLAGAVWSELIVGVWEFQVADWKSWFAAIAEAVALAFIVLALRRRYLKPLRQLQCEPPALAFLAVGLLYLAAIVVLRWRNQFDPYNFRLLGPGALLVTMALVRIALVSWPAARLHIAGWLVFLASLSIFLALVALPRPWQLRHSANVTAVERRYSGIPAGSIIVFGDDDLRYLRPDLFVAIPLCPPWFLEHETWTEFLSRMDGSRKIFLNISKPPLDLGRCDASIRNFMASYPPGKLVVLPSATLRQTKETSGSVP